MALEKISFRPGVNKQLSQTQGEGGWFDASLVRFRDGLPQKWSGWQTFIPAIFSGICRTLLAWQQLSGQTNLALFSNKKQYITQGGLFTDITPVDVTGTLGANPFTTASGSKVITIAHSAHGRNPGDAVIFSGAAAFNGVTIAGEYEVLAVPAPTSTAYSIQHSVAASAAGSGGGASVAYTYLIPVGAADAIFGPGWGADPWGSGTWGTPRQTTIKSQSPRIITADNWGEDLLYCVRDGGLYRWVASAGMATRASAIPNAPASAKAIIIGLPERHVIALGAESGGTLDPLLVRWSDVENYIASGSWTATATNSAGSFRLMGGTKIMNGRRTQNGILVWTDDVLYLMQFVGLPYVYSFRPQGAGSGLIAVNAAVDVNGEVHWVGQGGFFSWRGAIRKMQSTLHNDFFGTGPNGLDRAQGEKVHVGYDSINNEVLVFYPSNAGSGECDRYLAHNLAEDLWYGGALARTAWLDRAVFPNPIGVSPGGQVYYHEVGVDADGQPISAYIESGYVDIGDGDAFVYIDRLIPDFSQFTGTLQITFKSVQYPNGPVFQKGPYTITPTTKFVRCPIRGRQVAIRISSSNVGDFWRLGAIRFDMQPDGGR